MTKINKIAARKLWNMGVAFVICASNLRPEMFGAYAINQGVYKDFDEMVNKFEYYNCINNETGHRAAFYIIS